MREMEFRHYLETMRRLQRHTIQSRVANCKRVESYEGDLDDHFQSDRLLSLMKRLTYSAEDQHRNREPNHKVPIAGDVRNGSATLKQAVTLYQRFRLDGRDEPAVEPSTQQSEPLGRKPAGRWPDWGGPDYTDIFHLAGVLTPLVRFLAPEIVSLIVEDNCIHGPAWSDQLRSLSINPDTYIWDGSPCAFPGVRRYAGSQEIAQFRGKAAAPLPVPTDCLCLDDNDYPKHLWAFVFTGKPFRKQGPPKYQLAHLADHKEHNNRWREEFGYESAAEPPPLFGLYTSPANLAYVPSGFLKPTDFSGPLRTLLLRRAYQLYWDICRLAPPPLVEKTEDHPDWHPCNFVWSEPVGTTENLGDFLAFRNRRISELFENRW